MVKFEKCSAVKITVDSDIQEQLLVFNEETLKKLKSICSLTQLSELNLIRPDYIIIERIKNV